MLTLWFDSTLICDWEGSESCAYPLVQVFFSTLVFTAFELPPNGAIGTRLLEFLFHARPDLVRRSICYHRCSSLPVFLKQHHKLQISSRCRIIWSRIICIAIDTKVRYYSKPSDVVYDAFCLVKLLFVWSVPWLCQNAKLFCFFAGRHEWEFLLRESCGES